MVTDMRVELIRRVEGVGSQRLRISRDGEITTLSHYGTPEGAEAYGWLQLLHDLDPRYEHYRRVYAEEARRARRLIEARGGVPVVHR